MPISLPDVTLCTVTSINHALTVRAMNKCLEHCSFADVVMISSEPINAPFRVELMPAFANGGDYAPFIFQNLMRYTASSHNLLVQYDGYIVDPEAWTNDFLNYDYIGAKWPWHIKNRRVGNSGFCLRSKKLLSIMAEMELPPIGTYVDDIYICHTMREELEATHSIKIATEEIADQFAYERHTPDMPSFGFHGTFNLWRHTDDAEMIEIINLLDGYYVLSRAYAEIMFRYFDSRKFNVFYSAYQRLRMQIQTPQLKDHLLQYLKDATFIDALIASGEKIYADRDHKTS